MLIISNFKDYYDGMAYLGVDKTIPFRRVGKPNASLKGTLRWMAQDRDLTKEEQDLAFGPIGHRHFGNVYEYQRVTLADVEGIFGLEKHPTRTKNYIGSLTFGFCGTIYKAIRVSLSAPHQEFTVLAGSEAFQEIEALRLKALGRSYGQYGFDQPNEIECEEFFKLIDRPYFALEGDTLLLDFPLTNTNLPSLIDAQTAWTKLEFFLTNSLRVNERETVEVDNHHKILAAGFDTKTSFRHPVKAKDLYDK